MRFEPSYAVILELTCCLVARSRPETIFGLSYVRWVRSVTTLDDAYVHFITLCSVSQPHDTVLSATNPPGHSPPSAKDAARAAGIAAGIAIPVVLLLFAIATWLVLRRRGSRSDSGASILPPAIAGNKYAVMEGQVINVSDGNRTAFKIEIYPENGLTPFPFTPVPEGGYPRTPPRRTPSADTYLAAAAQRPPVSSRLATEVKQEVTVPKMEKAPRKPGWREFGRKPKKDRMSIV